jgi:hypothetical protein
MASIATNTADNVGGKVALFGAIVFAMTDLSTVLTSLVFIVTQCTVESGEFSKLVAFELVLTFGNRGSCFNNIVDQLLGLVDLLLRICHDQTVKIFFLVASVSSIGSTFSFLDGTFASNGNLGSGFLFHGLESVATRSDKQTNFSEARELSVSMSVSSRNTTRKIPDGHWVSKKRGEAS